MNLENTFKIPPFNRHVILIPKSLGVALMCTGVIELYKKRIGNKPIHIIAYHNEFFENLSFVDEVHKITNDYRPIEENIFENVIFDAEYKSMLGNLDTQPHRRPEKKHITQLLAQKLDIDCNVIKPIFKISTNDLEFAENLIDNIKKKGNNMPIIYLGMQAATINKMWSITKWAEFTEHNKNKFTFISYDDFANHIPQVIKIETTITSIFAILKLVDACITVDSFPLHVASCRGVDTKLVFCILGSSHPDVVCYDNTKVIYMKQKDLDCQPCGRPYSLFDKSPNGSSWECSHLSCLRNIKVSELTNLVNDYF